MFDSIKNIFNKIGTFFTRLFEKDVFIKISSIIAAIVIWFGVTISEFPTINDVIYNVPVEIALRGTYAEANGYQPMVQSSETVNVYITGARGQIGNLDSSDLVAVASADEVMYAREYSLPLEIECKTGKTFEVTRIEPSTISVNFDRIITKEVELVPMMTGVKAADGYIMGDSEDIVIVPNTVNITGLAEMIDSITDAAAVIEEVTSLTGTTDFRTSSIRLMNGSSAIIDETEAITFDKSDFTVHVPVYARSTIALDVQITNAPESFNVDSFKEMLEFSVSELEVAILGENTRDFLDIGTIDMREVDIGTEFTFSTDAFLPEGYQDLNEVHTVTVKCPSEGLVRRSIHFTNSQIQLVNAPSQFEFNIITSGVTPIFIGPEESMEQLTYIDVNAQIDMLNGFDMEEGYHKLPITFVIPSHSDVWCIGSDGVLSPRATIEATLKNAG